MYSTSIQLFTRLLPYVALAVGGQIIIDIVGAALSAGSSTIFASALVWGALAYQAHVLLLVPKDSEKSNEASRVLGFVFRSLGLGFLVAIPTVVVAIVMAVAFKGGEIAIVSPAGLGIILGIGVFSAVFFLITFSLLGTVLPAFVANRGRGMSAALSRGGSQFGWLCGHLLLGPVLLVVASLLVAGIGGAALGGEANLMSAHFIPNIPVILIVIIIYLINALGTITLAWTLSTAFLRSEEGQPLEAQYATA